MSPIARKCADLVVLLIAAVIGVTSFIAFLIFVYVGSLGWVNLDMGDGSRLVVDTLLSLAFFVQHSSMVRKSFRRRLRSFVPHHYQGAVYTISSGLVLWTLVVLWQGSERVLLEVRGLPGGIMRSLYFLLLLGTGWGTWALRAVDMFGLDSIIKNLQAKPSANKRFTIRGPYRWVRHPLYLFAIILLWSCPILTSDRLLFNCLWTIWIVIGSILEDRDLADDFGDAYRAYQAKVPLLVPRGFHPAYPGR